MWNCIDPSSIHAFLSEATMRESSPANKLKVGLLVVLCSLPLVFHTRRGIFAGVLVLAGLILCFDGLVQNQKWEKAKKQAARQESTKR